ncbi:hypothetical protein Tco_0883214 [Tanacetum coccineum]
MKSQPKNKNRQEESTVAFEELTTHTSSKKASSSKKTKPSKKDVGTPALEVSSNGKSLIEVSLEDEQSKGTTKKPRKRKPKTHAKSSTESNEALQTVDVIDLPSKSKPSSVLPSYGHVRDLAARSGSVRPDDDFSMVWEVPSAA